MKKNLKQKPLQIPTPKKQPREGRNIIWFWLTYNVGISKTIPMMLFLAALSWGIPIYITEANPYRIELLEDFERWEIWFAVIGTIISWIFVLFMQKSSNGNRKKFLQELLLKNVKANSKTAPK